MNPVRASSCGSASAGWWRCGADCGMACMWNRDALPPEGPLIYIMNHQSLLDPPLVGVLVRRRPCVLGSQRAVCLQALWGLHSLHVCDSSGHCPRRRSRASLGHPRAGSRAVRVDFSRGSTDRRRPHGPLPWRSAVARTKDQCPGGPIGHRWVVGRLEQAPQVAPVGQPSACGLENQFPPRS